MRASRSLRSSVKRSFSFFSCSTSPELAPLPLEPFRVPAPGEALRGVLLTGAGAGAEVVEDGTTPPTSATEGAGLTGVEADLGASDDMVDVGAEAAGLVTLACRVCAGEAGTLDVVVFLTGAEAAEDWSSKFCHSHGVSLASFHCIVLSAYDKQRGRSLSTEEIVSR